MAMRRRRWVLALVLLAALIGVRAAVRGEHAPASANSGTGVPGLTTHTVEPARADPGVTGPAAPDLALAGRPSHDNGLLLVFLPGTGATPSCCTEFLTSAVSLGYRALALTYENGTAVGGRDGVSHRLASVLAYLADRYPRERWGRFLHAGQPVWSSIVMSGHSLGGGEATFIGTVRKLRGVVALSSPPDTNLAGKPASWVASVPRGPTPLSRIVAFVHSGDPFYRRILADWDAMRLASLGRLTSVDGEGSPYGRSHQLVSSAPLPRAPLATHNGTAVDAATPRCRDGSPEYAPVWDYMLEVAGGLPVLRGTAGCAG